MLDLSTLGECMLRLSPPGYETLEQCHQFRVEAAGSESSVAIALSRLGARTAWLSSLPQNPLGRRIANKIREHGVDVSQIVWSYDARVGTFYVEYGLMPRSIRVIYDRAGSAASRLTVDQVDWSHFFNTRLVHLTGITPALSHSCQELVAHALEGARERGITTSFDINYRQQLWRPEQARTVLSPLLSQVDVLLSTHVDAMLLFGLSDHPEEAAVALQDRFSCQAVVLTLSTGGAVAQTDRLLQIGALPVEKLDRLGAGDAFDAGFLYGWLHGDTQMGLAYGSAMAALSHTEYGDITWATEEDVKRLLDDPRAEIVR